MIRIGSAIKRALDLVLENHVQSRSGIYVPPAYIAGRHFGGFDGYSAWIQDCIRAACANVRGVGSDELSELTALTLWQPQEVLFTVAKHADTMALFEQFANRVADTSGGGGLTANVIEQIQRVEGSRERGTLLVIALNPAESERTGELKACVSAWNPASFEEAAAVPKQRYLLG